MGLLSFLKRENDRLRAPLKAQAYHTTTPAEPPVKGTLPQVGSTATNQRRPAVRRHVPRRIDNNSSRSFTGDTGPVTSEFAPPPVVPRLADHDLSRPLSLATTPNASRPTSSHKTSTSWLRREQPATGNPPLSFRKPRIKSMISTRRSFPEKPAEVRQEFFFEPSPVVKPPRPQTAHTRQVSVQAPATNGAGANRAFVDILDAHSEIKPANFRSRVHAAGARDYGEDVADRNIAINVPDTTQKPLRRAVSYHPPAPREVPLHLQRLPSSPEATRSLHHINDRHADSEIYTTEQFNLPPPLPYHDSRTQSASSLNFSPFPNRGDVSTPRGAGTPPRTSRAKKTGVHTGQGRRADIQPRGRFPVHPTPVVSDNGGTNARPRPATLSRGHSSDKNPPRPKTSYSSRSASEWSFSHLGAGREELFEFPVLEDLNVPARRQRSASQTKSLADGTFSRDRPHTARPPSRGESVYSAPPLPLPGFRMRSRAASIGERSDYRPVSRDRDNSTWANGYGVGRIDIESDVDPNITSPAPSPHIRRGDRPRHFSHYQHREPESLLDYERTHTLASLKNMSTTKLDEIIEAVPRRGSSLRHSSISSITPTTSSMSSNPFARPYSRHTAQTSVDLALPHSPGFPASPKFPASSSHSSLSGTNYGTSYCGTTVGGREDSLYSPLTSSAPTIVKVNSFNMDDYMSSEDELDDELYAEKQAMGGLGVGKRYKTPDDESLLFSDSGYGFRGAQLPGLFEAIPELPSESPPSEAPRYLRHSLSTPGPLSILKAQDEIYGDAEADHEERQVNEDEGEVMDVSSRVRALRASLYESIELEARGGVEPKSAGSIRKEAKIRARVAACKGKGVLYGDDEGHASME